MPTNTGDQTIYGVGFGKERPVIILGSTLSSRVDAEQQLTDDRDEFMNKDLGVVVIKPGEEYTIASMATEDLH